MFSDMLVERRRQLGYSIPQASRVLRLREDVLVAFEEGDFSRMPKSGYAQGMLSSYARYLGLDAAEVVEAYARDYEQYRREDSRHIRRNTSPQELRETRVRGGMYVRDTETYVTSKGLLPTSGGLAGDLGSFATTRVRTRASSSDTGDLDTPWPTEPVPAYPQTRPYTGRTPSGTHRSSRDNGYAPRTSGNIQTQRYDASAYQDDLRLGRDAQPYESASTSRGRRSSRNIGNAQRPRVARSGSRGRRGASTSGRRGSRRPPTTLERLLGNTSQAAVFVVLGVIVLLSVILVLSVSSCVRQDNEAVRTVPVSAASSDDAAKDASAGKPDATASTTDEGTKDASGGISSSTSASDDSKSASSAAASASSQKETSVSVSVADGAVTWLEVECDGKSDIADTITGPWQRTYTVEDSLSVQASDTTAVTVVQNGRQMQFDSMASGIGTLRVQGTKIKSKDSDKGKGSANGGGSAKTGNASSDTDSSQKEKADGQDGTAEDVGTNADEGSGDTSGTAETYDDYGNDY